MGSGSSSGREIRLAIEGELDLEAARLAEAELGQHPTSEHQLVLDLSRVLRFDFSGIVVLLDALARLGGHFSGVSVLGLSERVSQVFMALRPPALQQISVNHSEADRRR